jgi:hypothetical protein
MVLVDTLCPDFRRRMVEELIPPYTAEFLFEKEYLIDIR